MQHLGRGLRYSLRVLAGLSLLAASSTALAQGSGSSGAYSIPSPNRPLGVYEAPGGFGMSWGTPSYGSVRTYSEFASPFGAGMSYGYAPYTVMPGPYGAGIWRPGDPAAAKFDTSTAGPNSYRTFAVPYVKGSTTPTPPVGAYAPAYGPGGPIR